ncbi:unnamed protein product [Bursaphelenchus okinawaensis]|uniref:Uncharacterized protein n=1 Tax=Bursaphelenchus okinawaensis TaxID=465554 RepID=A0A811K995_9BILA|nr:unnamed protein product [Bursaphelenchus okinawaensis]CAG9096930.1 unnamed protein product [Bursaphelenchus okinawaensis]
MEWYDLRLGHFCAIPREGDKIWKTSSKNTSSPQPPRLSQPHLPQPSRLPKPHLPQPSRRQLVPASRLEPPQPQ